MNKEIILKEIEKLKEKIFKSIEFYASSKIYEDLMELQEKIKKYE